MKTQNKYSYWIIFLTLISGESLPFEQLLSQQYIAKQNNRSYSTKQSILIKKQTTILIDKNNKVTIQLNRKQQGLTMGNNQNIQKLKQDKLIEIISHNNGLNESEFKKQIVFLNKKQYELTGYLGKGAFGLVISAYSPQFNHVAIKIMDKKLVNEQDLTKETQTLEKVSNSKYLLKTFESFGNEDLKTYYIVSELCDCSLSDIVNWNKLTKNQVLSISNQLLLGLQELEELNIVHCDIKPENILYNQKSNKFMYADFGLSKMIKTPLGRTIANTQVGGTLIYMAPEICDQFEKLTNKVDVFSLGITIGEIIRGKKFDSFDAIFGTKNDLILKFMPKNENYEDFNNNILVHMAKKSKSERKDPKELLLILNQNYQFEESELKNLKVMCNNFEGVSPNQEVQKLNDEMNTLNSIQSLKDFKDKQKINLQMKPNSIGKNGTQLIYEGIKYLSQLTQLELNLSSNSIGDKEIKFIGKGIKELVQLSELNLNLSFNSIEQNGVEIILKAIESLAKLTSLNLNLESNKITKDGAKIIGKKISNLTKLINLNLNMSSNKIESIGLFQLYQGIQNLTQLTQLNFNFSTCQMESFDDNWNDLFRFKNLTKLTELNLNISNNKVGKIGIEFITQLIVKNITQLNLNFEKNQFTENEYQLIAIFINNTKSLTHLDLNFSNTNIGETSKYIFSGILEQINLTNLNLNFSNNSIGEGLSYYHFIAEELKNLTSLKMDLENNNIKADVITLFFAFGLIKQVQLTNLDLNLSKIQLGNNNPEFLSKSLQVMSKLTQLKLNLSSNSISNEGALSLFDKIKNLPSLTKLHLDLSFNRVKQKQANIIIEGLTSLPQLTEKNVVIINNDEIVQSN